MVDLRLLSGRLFRSTNGVMFLAAAAFLGMLYLIPLYFQDARGLSALQSGLSTFPEAFGVMIGAQFASRLIYPRIGPRRHITGGLIGLALAMLALTQVSVTTNLWLIRGLMFVLGWMMAQVMVPNQAASFAMISPESMGRASTFFNTMRQVGSADGRRRPLDGADRRRVDAGLRRHGRTRHDRLPPRVPHRGRLRARSAPASPSPSTTATPRRRSCGAGRPEPTSGVPVPEGSPA